MPDNDLSGRVALVTGGSRGIGRAICRRLARAGAWVAINYASSDEAAQETLAEIRADGGEGGVYKADVSSFGATDAMFGRIEAESGPVDLLVTNAGIASFQDDVDMPVELWRRILSVNLDGTFHCVWRAKAGMLARGRRAHRLHLLDQRPGADHDALGQVDRLRHVEVRHHRVRGATARSRSAPPSASTVWRPDWSTPT